MKKVFSWLLMASFVLTLLVPFTGVIVHKLASTVFLLLCLVHVILYRKKIGPKRWAMLGGILLAFGTGVLSLIFAQIPLVLAIHKAVSITCVFFLAIHIFVFAWRRSLREGTER